MECNRKYIYQEMSNHRLPLGLKRGELHLSPYRDEWPMLFESEKKIIELAIGHHVADIQHVGSTAIVGMPAKPILDIAIAVEDFEKARVCIDPLVALGYTFRGENGIPRRHYFQKGEPCTHHVHMVEASSEGWAKLIRFRDILRADRSTAADYRRLKLDMWEKLPGDRKAYQAAKAASIEEIIRRTS